MEGKGEEPREKSRDGTSWDWSLALKESSHLVLEPRPPAASSAESACLSQPHEGAGTWVFLSQVCPSLPDAPAPQPIRPILAVS